MAQGLVMRRQGQLQNILETAAPFPRSSHASALEVSLAPSGVGRSWIVTHGLRRGLHYRAAAGLNGWCPEMHRSLGGSRFLRDRAPQDHIGVGGMKSSGIETGTNR